MTGMGGMGTAFAARCLTGVAGTTIQNSDGSAAARSPRTSTSSSELNV